MPSLQQIKTSSQCDYSYHCTFFTKYIRGKKNVNLTMAPRHLPKKPDPYRMLSTPYNPSELHKANSLHPAGTKFFNRFGNS